MTKDEVKYEALDLSLVGNLITVTGIKQSIGVIFSSRTKSVCNVHYTYGAWQTKNFKTYTMQDQFTRNVCVCICISVKHQEWVPWKQMMVFAPNSSVFKNIMSRIRGKRKRRRYVTCNSSLRASTQLFQLKSIIKHKFIKCEHKHW